MREGPVPVAFFINRVNVLCLICLAARDWCRALELDPTSSVAVEKLDALREGGAETDAEPPDGD